MPRSGLILLLSTAQLVASLAPGLAEEPARPMPKRSAPQAITAGTPRKFEPYDPDRAKAGRRPGFIDLGNGTEIRVGGRARFDDDVRR